jgi:hypothetical protein
VPVSEFGAWAVSHMGPVKFDVVFNPDAPAQTYFDLSIHTKVKDYAEAVRALHGSDHNLSSEPLETDVIIRLGQGRKHGRLWIADGADSLSSTPSLSLRREGMEHGQKPSHTCTAYSNTVAGRRTSGNSGFTHRTLNITHIDQICHTEICD